MGAAIRLCVTAAKTLPEQSALQRQIDSVDRSIDQLVHELYGLTDTEIKIALAGDCRLACRGRNQVG